MLDTLITGWHLLTMAGPGVGFVEDGAVGIRGRKIVAGGPRREVVEAQGHAATTIDARDRLVMPGLVHLPHHGLDPPRPRLTFPFLPFHSGPRLGFNLWS